MKLNKAPNYNWYTPPSLVEPSRRAMGGITLDPASCEEANEVVKAGTYLSESQNGLEYSWQGNIFLNPPYNDMPAWVEKLISEYQAGNTKQAILISKADTSTQWFRRLWDYAICFLYTRTRFIAGLQNEGKEKNGPQFPIAVVYLGANQDRFLAEFADMGKIVIPAEIASSHKTKPAQVLPVYRSTHYDLGEFEVIL